MKKHVFKRITALAIAAVMLLALLPAGGLAEADAKAPQEPQEPTRANLNTGCQGLTASSGGSGTWAEPAAGSISGLVKSTRTTNWIGYTYTSQTGTLTLTNDSTYNATLSFTWTKTAAKGTLKIGGSTQSAASGTYSGDINIGSTLSIQLTSDKSADGYETGIGVTFSNFTLTPKEVSATVTFVPGEHGSYTVNGTSVESSVSITQLSTVPFELDASPDEDYEFYGWYDVTHSKYISYNNPTMLHIGQNITLRPKFLPANSPQFLVGSTIYNDLNEANTAAQSASPKTITLVGDGIVRAGNYTISSGVTLLIPYESSYTIITNSNLSSHYYAYTSNYDSSLPAAVPYKTLTVDTGAKITVNGSVSVASGVHIMSQGQAGPYGLINMNAGSEIAFENGSKLYAFGYIKGTGAVNVKSGATVYENLFVADYPGSASNVNTLKSAGVFPFSKYSVKNVQAPMTVYSGASESVYFNLYGTNAGYHDVWLSFIGTSSSLFRTSGTLTKSFVNGRQVIRSNGTSSINPMTISISAFGVSISVNTSDLAGLPIPYNFTLNVDSGTVTLNENVILSKGSVANVAEGASVVVASGKNLYVLDGSDDLQAVGTQPDARLNVNGSVEVNGKLWTSTNKAEIVSGGTGMVHFASSVGTSTTTVKVKTGSTTAAEVAVAPASLKNGVEDPAYAETAGTGTSTWHYDPDGLQWYRYKVDFVYNGAVVGHGYFCENGSTVSYDASWLTGLSASVTSGSASASVSGTAVNVTNITSDCTVTLTGTAAQYIPVFVLNERQYASYVRFTGSTLTETRQIGGETYYVVDKAPSALSVGTAYSAPSDASMGVSGENHNGIVWNLSGVSARSGMNYSGTVPAGGESGGEIYVYGFYTGLVAYNSRTGSYYPTLADAMADVPMSGACTVRLEMDCGSFEDENAATAFTIPENANVTIDVNGFLAVGRLINNGRLTIDLKGGIWQYRTGAAAAAAAYKGLAAIINNGSLTVMDTVGGGSVTSDAISNSSGSDGSAVIRNNAGATLAVTGKSADSLLAVSQLQNVNAYNYGIYNLGTITELTNVDISTGLTGSSGLNLYNYNTGVVELISGGHMFCLSDVSIYNYGGTINEINGLTIDGKYGISNRNIRGGAIATGYTVQEADIGVIDTIRNSRIEVGFYAINNHAVINSLENSVFIGHPDSAQVDTRGNGLGTASDGNNYCYTIFNNYDWWYNTNVWKQVDSTSGGYFRTNYYKEDDNCRPLIGQIINCGIYAENTSTSSSHGYALVNYGIINKIGGTTNIKTYKHPDNSKISTSHYALNNLYGGIIRSIEGTVNVSATGIGTVYNDGVFTQKIEYTYSNKVDGIVTHQLSTYGEPSAITSVTCAGAWSCGSYYALYNTGYIQTIAAPSLTISGNTSSYNVIYNASNGANSSYDYTRYYTDVNTAATEYRRVAVYTKNLEKGSTIGTLSGVTLVGCYYVLNNQGHIGTLSNVTVSNNAASNNPTVLNGDLRYAVLTEDRQTNRTSDTDAHLTVSSGIATRYDRQYTCSTPTIDTIDNLTINSNGQYGLRNAGAIGTLKNSVFTATTNYALHNSASGPFTERTTLQYYSGTSIFATSKYISEYSIHYKRNAATINTIDNCEFKTNTGGYAAFNTGHIGTISNSVFRAGATTNQPYALANINSQELEYTRNLEEIMYVTANGATACTAYWGTGGESDVVVYDYDAPSIDLIGGGNTFAATTTVIANTGVISAIDSGNGALTTVTGSAAKGSAIYNYSACLDSRTTTTPYTAAASPNASGTKGNAVNSDTLLPGAEIGSIKRLIVNANGVGVLNGDGVAGKLPTIGELGEGLEINANCTTGGYHAIQNNANAKITAITGGVYTAVTAATYAYRNNNTDAACATLISGGDFKGNPTNRGGAILEPDNTNRQTYPEGNSLVGTETVTFHDGTTASGYFFIGEYSAATYTITWKNWDGTLLGTSTVTEGEIPTYSGQTPTKPADAQYTYTFSGWTPALAPATADAEYTAAFSTTVNKYTITWLDGDGYTLKTEQAAYGATPVYSGATPTKTGNAQYSYTFNGNWSPAIVPVTGNATYTAQFDAVVNEYTITWVIDGEYETQTYAYGATPAYNGATPTKEPTVQYTYAFAGWSPEIHTVTGNETYVAVFTATLRKYNIRFVDEDGTTVLYEAEFDYGTMPAYSGEAPTKAETAQYTYTFAGWTPELAEVTGEATYTAAYTATLRKYLVKFVDEDGTTVLYEAEFDYGTMPAYSGETPTKAETAQYTYAFAGWTPELAEVTGEATYTATYTATLRKYLVKFVDEDGTTVLYEAEFDYGTMPAYSGETPTKAETAQYTYTFAGWTPELAEVTGEATYTATYTETLRTFTVRFIGFDGEELSVQTVPYGGSATAPEAPAVGTYVFVGWDAGFTDVQSDLTINARYFLKGDYNRNGLVNATDALLLLRATMEMDEDYPFPEDTILICDMNNNGTLNATDALLILRYSMEQDD